MYAVEHVFDAMTLAHLSEREQAALDGFLSCEGVERADVVLIGTALAVRTAALEHAERAWNLARIYLIDDANLLAFRGKRERAERIEDAILALDAALAAPTQEGTDAEQ